MTNLRYTHLSSIKSEPLKEILKHNFPNIQNTHCICNACRLKYSKKVKDSAYTPEKKKVNVPCACFLSNFMLCSASGDVSISLNRDDFNEIFSLECEAIPEQIKICRKHRTHISNYQTLRHCTVCNTLIRGGERKYLSQTLTSYAVDRLQQLSPTLLLVIMFCVPSAIGIP